MEATQALVAFVWNSLQNTGRCLLALCQLNIGMTSKLYAADSGSSWKCTYNSKEKVDVTAHKALCVETYIYLLQSFNNDSKWISVSPTVHSLLSHSWELIANNQDTGFGEY